MVSPLSLSDSLLKKERILLNIDAFPCDAEYYSGSRGSEKMKNKKRYKVANKNRTFTDE
jgi:hypothetical protein